MMKKAMVFGLALASVAFGQNKADLDGDGCVTLADVAAMQVEFEGPECSSGLVNMPMSIIHPGGPGPDYVYLMGTFEVTNAQYVAFLNDVEKDDGRTERGRYVGVRRGGLVMVDGGSTTLLARSPLLPPSKILYEHFPAAAGSRFRVMPGFETHPVAHVSWYGAVKFCNWLTIESGLGVDNRCYSEGPVGFKWHPVTISDSEWLGRDLNDEERRALVDGFKGFRLPMDCLGTETSFVSNQENPFNEWYRAAAYDPRAPGFARDGVNHEVIPAFHWAYGYGRDKFDFRDVNYEDSLNPMRGGSTSVGYFDGDNLLLGDLGRTRDTNNLWGMYDLSGNIGELTQTRIIGSRAVAVRGGSFRRSFSRTSTSWRSLMVLDETNDSTGFRVLRVP